NFDRKRNRVETIVISECTERNEHRQSWIRLRLIKTSEQLFIRRRQQNNLFRWNRVVTGARKNLHVRTSHFNLYFAERAVEVLIAAAISERVARLDLLIDSLESLADIVVAFDKLAARVARETM